ncbi:MAG: ABC transporter ATP-binding protein [Bacteroidota bacterium]|nr:ABC transporter ATP-binding protein [Bacteroidota bacterium]
MIQLKGINKSFDQLKVLKDIDIHVKKGEFVTIAGPSGAGKTTLLQIAGTLMNADTGETVIDGKSIRDLKERELSAFRNRHIGFVFQFHHLLPEFTALENICIPAYIGGKSKNETEDRALELLDFLSMTHRKNHKPSELSGGEQQRVAVARSLINKPAIVLADEPSGNLDMQNSQELHNLFFKLRDTYNQTFIVVTHNQELAKMSDRTILLRDGAISS